ncbi:hypothetical protein BKA61DRAFT_656563 [Leptodontidium sp. MPI-SDFR-AT-0119]|nr:hypothetical protein BKA61DRAFT_656563 [Leptodontidium sp. MPI-SDFR-AT-0119]
MANSLPQTTASYRKVYRKTDAGILIPYENFVGAFLGGRYRLQLLQYQEESLDVYSITNLFGRSYEAQAFSLSESGVSANLLQARKRRMKRLFRSKNFVDEIQQAGKRFLITDIDRNDKERNNLYRRHLATDWMSQDLSCLEKYRANFPNLSATEESPSKSSPTRNDTGGNLSSYLGMDSYDSQHPVGSFVSSCAPDLPNSRSNWSDTDTPSYSLSSHAPSSIASQPSSWSSWAEVASHTANSSRATSCVVPASSGMYSSYAEAASKGLDHDKSSKTRKGCRQRQRRQRKRETKGSGLSN